MMRPRYLALVASPDERIRCTELRRHLRRLSGFTLLHGSPALELWSDGGRVAFRSDTGALIGEIFGSYGDGRREGLTPLEWECIISSCGQQAIDRFWGRYILFLPKRHGVRIVRAPFGDIGCFFATSSGVVAIASDLDLLLGMGAQRPDIDHLGLIRHIGYPEWRGSGTCLAGIGELRGGDALDVTGGSMRITTLWSPWSFTGDERRIVEREECARRVRDVVTRCVRQKTQSVGRVVVLLSGGLDSSVVAASLARSEIDFSCLNLVGEDSASDERDYASAVARHLGVELTITQLDPDLVDPLISTAALMPYPVQRCFTQAQDTIGREQAMALGARAVLDGGGGDNVFFALRTVAILADSLIDSGFDHRFRRLRSDLASATQVAPWQLTFLAAWRAWCRSWAPRQGAFDHFLSPAARSSLAAMAKHSWFTPPNDCLPGRAAHVALLAPAQNLVEAINAHAEFPAISPLVAQPIVETCLRIPSWFWLERGRDRAATRSAFAPVLPRSTIERQSKSTPSGFVAGIFERHRSLIRDMLLGGQLHELGLIDEARVGQYLDLRGPVTDYRFARIMELVDVEAWLRCQRH